MDSGVLKLAVFGVLAELDLVVSEPRVRQAVETEIAKIEPYEDRLLALKRNR